MIERTTAPAATPVEPLGYCAHDILKALPQLPGGCATVDELHARLPKYSNGLIRKACQMLVNIGEIRVRSRYERRPGRMPNEYAPAPTGGVCDKVAGGIESLAPDAYRPGQDPAAHAASEGFSK